MPKEPNFKFSIRPSAVKVLNLDLADGFTSLLVRQLDEDKFVSTDTVAPVEIQPQGS
jgi:hypothetical protein